MRNVLVSDATTPASPNRPHSARYLLNGVLWAFWAVVELVALTGSRPASSLAARSRSQRKGRSSSSTAVSVASWCSTSFSSPRCSVLCGVSLSRGARPDRAQAPALTGCPASYSSVAPEGAASGGGMTETSPVSFQTHPDDPLEKRVATLGQIHPHVEGKLVDPASGQIVPARNPRDPLPP